MTLFYLVRHASHARQDDGTLVGRTSGIGLGDAAPAQLGWLRERLARTALDAVLSGPLPRAAQTARGVAGEPVLAPELDEVDFGDWTGQRIDELAGDPTWRNWNAFRSGTRIPGGETMLEVQARIVGLAQRICRDHPHGRVLVVSHGDVLRALVLHGLGLSLDHWARFELDPGSLSVLALEPWGARLLRLNEQAATPGGDQSASL